MLQTNHLRLNNASICQINFPSRRESNLAPRNSHRALTETSLCFSKEISRNVNLKRNPLLPSISLEMDPSNHLPSRKITINYVAMFTFLWFPRASFRGEEPKSKGGWRGSDVFTENKRLSFSWFSFIFALSIDWLVLRELLHFYLYKNFSSKFTKLKASVGTKRERYEHPIIG